MSPNESLVFAMRRLGRLTTMGFRGPRGRQMKHLVLCQWIFGALLLFIWIRYNGGLWPHFLNNTEVERVADENLLDYFPSAGHDGALIKWTRGVNNMEALQQAVTSDTMMIVADVNADGSVIVMSASPLISSAMTFDLWLDNVKLHKKGFKLEFHNIQSVEMALRKLRNAKTALHMPIQLSASVIGDSHHHTKDHPSYIHADEFLRLCVTQFPESTLALGWASTDLGFSATKPVVDIPKRYNWTDVKLMYDLIEKWQVKQPITLVANARLVRHSVAQLKWLMEMTGASLTLHAGATETNDATSVLDLLYVRHRLPLHSVYYDIPPALMNHFGPIRDDDGRVRQNVLEDVKRAFVADQWHIVKSREGETIYLGTESVLLQTGLLLTKVEYSASAQHSVTIEGQVEFFDAVDQSEVAAEIELRTDVGLAVFLRATQSSRADSITGIRCFMGITGMLKIETRGVPGANLEVTGAIPGTAPCFRFKIIDQNADKISLNVSRPKSCSDWSKLDYNNFVTLPMKGVSTEASYIAIRQSLIPGSKGPLGFTAVDEFTIRTSPLKPASIL